MPILWPNQAAVRESGSHYKVTQARYTEAHTHTHTTQTQNTDTNESNV